MESDEEMEEGVEGDDDDEVDDDDEEGQSEEEEYEVEQDEEDSDEEEALRWVQFAVGKTLLTCDSSDPQE